MEFMRNMCVIGAGYVGLVTAACFAELGHRVTLLEIDPEKVNALEQGVLPVYEPGLPELWQRHRAGGRLHLTNDYKRGLEDSEFAFVAVGTPSTKNGKPDLRWVRSAARGIAEAANGHIVVVNKSTVPVGTAELVASIIARYRRSGQDFAVVSNPEFLREGCAVFDFMHPMRVVVGSSDAYAAQAVVQLYEVLERPIILCDVRTAEMSKYASNAFLATRISFINEIALLCDKLDVNVTDVAKVVGMEPRCGDGYLGAGLGWGGSCLPKDVRALIHMASSQGASSPLLRSVAKVNYGQPRIVVTKLQRLLGSLEGKTIGILGLSFKPDSDDMREASSLSVSFLLEEQGCLVKAYDPKAMGTATKLMPSVTYCADAYEVARGSDALVLVTDWDEFKELDMRRVSSSMNYPILIDGRNFFDPEEMIEAGFIYDGVGRGSMVRGKQEAASIKPRVEEAQLAVSGAAPVPSGSSAL
jgi:UDPglucose 6-dehydrogenase